MIQVQLAVYDPSDAQSVGNYWIWQSQDISRELLDEAYRSIRSNLPPDPNHLGAEDIWSGFVRLSGGHCCLYRVFNGGRDHRGRPGRFVILAGLMPWPELVRCDAPGLLTSGTFNPWPLDRAVPCPPPRPVSLDVDVQVSLHAGTGDPEDTWNQAWQSAAKAPNAPQHWAFRQIKGLRSAEKVTGLPNAAISRSQPLADQTSEQDRSTSTPSRPPPLRSPQRGTSKPPWALILLTAGVSFTAGLFLSPYLLQSFAADQVTITTAELRQWIDDQPLFMTDRRLRDRIGAWIDELERKSAPFATKDDQLSSGNSKSARDTDQPKRSTDDKNRKEPSDAAP